MLARGAQHHESERAACKQASTEQQRGHAEDARDGWLRGQERRSRTLGVVVRVARGGRVPSRPECEHTPRCSVGAHSTLRGTHAPSRLRSGLACLTVRRVRPSAVASIGTWAPGGGRRDGIVCTVHVCTTTPPYQLYLYLLSLNLPTPRFFLSFHRPLFPLREFSLWILRKIITSGRWVYLGVGWIPPFLKADRNDT